MVRLKVEAFAVVHEVVTAFQFQYGTIERFLNGKLRGIC